MYNKYLISIICKNHNSVATGRHGFAREFSYSMNVTQNLKLLTV